jgi:hypothetical protein
MGNLRSNANRESNCVRKRVCRCAIAWSHQAPERLQEPTNLLSNLCADVRRVGIDDGTGDGNRIHTGG